MFEVLHLFVLLLASFNKTLFYATNNPACIVFINAVYQYWCTSIILSCFLLFIR